MTFFLGLKAYLAANPLSIPACGAKKTLLNVEFPLKKIIGKYSVNKAGI